ncbi:MAG: DUF222 domain-containing protein [Gammaproteobacteria bacterium]|nr:DUF222 domain-containing protein [Gammaproteobacteria bacterium]
MNTAPLVRTSCPLDELESSLLTSWREATQAEYRFLKLLGEFNLRRGWEAYGNGDCAQWLNWRCGISRTTAQEKVRVADALWHLPKIDEAFRRGDLSYSKVRALTRVASDVTEGDLLAFALKTSASQCEAYCRRLRNGDPVVSAADAQRLHEGRSLIRHFREDGSASMTVELPRESLELVLAALERVGARLPEDPSRSLFARAADALVMMARESLAGEPGVIFRGRPSGGGSCGCWRPLRRRRRVRPAGADGQASVLRWFRGARGRAERQGARRSGRKQRTVPHGPRSGAWAWHGDRIRTFRRPPVPRAQSWKPMPCAPLGRRRRDQPGEPAAGLQHSPYLDP